MRQTYIPDKETYQMYRSFFNQTGGGYNPGGYIYNNHQVGSGLGGFFRSALKFALPIGKKLLYKGWEIAKPEVTKVAKSGVDAAFRVASNKIKSASAKSQKKLDSIGQKRKIDALGS